jgi:ribosomal protein L40E
MTFLRLQHPEKVHPAPSAAPTLVRHHLAFLLQLTKRYNCDKIICHMCYTNCTPCSTVNCQKMKCGHTNNLHLKKVKCSPLSPRATSTPDSQSRGLNKDTSLLRRGKYFKSNRGNGVEGKR